MTLPTSGAIRLSQIRAELSVSGSALSMGSQAARVLAQKESGVISIKDFYGRTCVTFTITAESVVQVDGGTVIGWAMEPNPHVDNMGGDNQIGSTDRTTFRGLTCDGIWTKSGTFFFSLPLGTDQNDPNFPYQPRGLFRAILVNGYALYEADATFSGSGGGRTLYGWNTGFSFSNGQQYQVRIMY